MGLLFQIATGVQPPITHLRYRAQMQVLRPARGPLGILLTVDDECAILARQKIRQRLGILKNERAKALAVAGKLERDRSRGDPGEIGPVGGVVGGQALEDQALRQGAPTDDGIARLAFTPQSGAEQLKRLIGAQAGFDGRDPGDTEEEIQQGQRDG